MITAFLVLGAELLAPEGIMPSGTDVAEQLTRLLSDVWGQVGHWLMVAAIVTALGGSLLANQDGWARSFADIVLVRDPVVIMSASGVVATIHTPFIVLATLAVNRRIPAGLRPGPVASSALALAGLFYTGFAVLYFADMAGLLGG